MKTHSELLEFAAKENRIDRRWFTAYLAALSAVPLLGRQSAIAGAPLAIIPKFKSDPFSLGVASGDPDSQSVVLWTRLAPEPLQPGGGMPAEAVEVIWEIASDEQMRSKIASGTSIASPRLGHSIHVEVDGLESDRWYWYRFRCGDATSQIGRTRTLPLPQAMPAELNFAFTSCQNYEQGLFTAYEQMVADDPELIFHLGDYIYEYEAGRTGKVRQHQGGEIESLDDYRIRYSQYRSDPLLQRAHAHCPWFVTWDDHEFDNNCAADISEERGIDPILFLARRANAYQAYYEMMPLRASCLPQGDSLMLYRNASYGKLADFMVLDTRQYRSDQPNGDRRSPLNESAMASSQSILGREQRNWLCGELIRSDATWNVLAQQVMMGMVARSVEDDIPYYSMDQWPGYAHERMQLARFLADRRVPNPVVLTGDIHSNWVNELRIDDRRPELPLVATEFVATSLSSGGNGVAKPKGLQQLLSNNPCVKFHNAERGYVRCKVTPQQWQSDYMVVSDVLQPGGTTSARASFVVEAGNPAVHAM